MKTSGKYNCAQSVTAALSDRTELSEKELVQISAGMGNMEATCGAIKCRDLKTITDGKPLCPCEECVRNAVLIYGR